MANPKKRTSARKRNTRRANIHLRPTSLIKCSNCQEPKVRHRVCPQCGHYKGQQVVETEY